MKRSLGLGLAVGVLLAFALTGLAQDKKDKEQKSSAKITVDKEKRTITIAAKVAPRKIDDPKFKGETYPVEVIATHPYPRGAKAHETVVTIEARPSEVHKALTDLGLKPGKPAKTAKDQQAGPEVQILLQLTPGKGRPVPIDRFLVDRKTGKAMPKVKWLFTGSEMIKTDPNKPAEYGADVRGTLITIFPVTAETVFQSDRPLAEEKYVKLEVSDKLPRVGTDVSLIIVVPEAK